MYPLVISKLNLSDKSKKQIKYRKARALQSKTQNKWQKSMKHLRNWMIKVNQILIWRLVIEILTDLRNQKEISRVMIRSVVWNAWGYVYLLMENMRGN